MAALTGLPDRRAMKSHYAAGRLVPFQFTPPFNPPHAAAVLESQAT